MFLIDDLLLAPVKGILWVFEEIRNAAEQELAGESDAITTALSELYMKLESGRITEAEFDAQEKVLLDRLDRLQAAEATPAALQEARGSRTSKKKRARKSPDTMKPAII
jgi:Gas vesicle protein G